MSHFFIVGLDLGTAYAKCLVHDANTGRKWAVDHSRNGDNHWFAPSLIDLNAEGKFIVPTWEEESRDPMRYVKMKVASGNNGHSQWEAPEPQWLENLSLAGNDEFYWACMALMIAKHGRTALLSIFDRYGDIGSYPHSTVLLRVSAPLANLEQTELEQRYHYAACKGWEWAWDGFISNSPDQLLADFFAEVKHPYYTKSIEIVPEVHAGTMAFHDGRMGEPHTCYLIIDVGAGTVDLSIMHYNPANADKPFTYLGTDVIPWGAGLLDLNNFSDISEEIMEETQRRIRSALVDAFKLGGQNPNGQAAKAWQRMRTVFAGGGREIPAYQRSAQLSQDNLHIKQFTAFNFPLPDGIENLPSDPDVRARFSVAYGLVKTMVDDFYPPASLAPLPKQKPKPRVVAPRQEDC